MQGCDCAYETSDGSKQVVKVFEVGFTAEAEMSAGNRGTPQRDYDSEVVEAAC
jgi:hypothetical protein